MSRISHSLPVEVAIGDCKCGDPAPHPEGDVVYLRPHLTLEGGLAAVAALTQAGTPSQVQERLSMALVRHGIVGWNFVDDEGKDIPVTPDMIDAALPWTEGGFLVANRAAELYGDTVAGPLANQNSKASPRGTTGASTSARRPKAKPTR